MTHAQFARTAGCILLGVAALLLGSAQSAGASVISSAISTPSDPSYIQQDTQNLTPITIAGSATDDGSQGNVDIRCYSGESSELFASEVPVSYTATSGTFSTSLLPSGLDLEQTCVLRAVPAGTEPPSVNAFSGPRVGFSSFESEAISTGPNSGDLQSFFISDSQLAGTADYRSYTDGGLYDGYPRTGATFTAGADLFYDNDTYDALTSASPPRSAVQVDGINVFGAASAASLFSESNTFAGFPELTVTHSYDPSSGDLTVHETDPLVQCAPEPAVYPPTESSCTSFLSAGVSVNRTIHQSHEGQRSTLTDSYTSTDGASHQLDLVSIEDAANTSAGYAFPWEDGDTYTERAGGETITPPSSGPASVLLDFDNTQPDGDSEGAQGAITFSSLPDRFAFAQSGPAGETHLTADFSRSLSASEPLTLSQTFSWAPTRAAVDELVTEAAIAAHPQITITAPSEGSTLTSTPAHLRGSVKAGGNGLPGIVTVAGQTVAVSSDGSWSTEVPLLAGSNTITASTTDPASLSSSTELKITYNPSETPSQENGSTAPGAGTQPGPVSQSPASGAGASNEGLTALHSAHLASVDSLSENSRRVLITIACQSQQPCKGRAGITFKQRRSKTGGRHASLETVTIAVAGFSIAAGERASVPLRFSATARSFLARHSPLAAELTVMLMAPGHHRAFITRPVTLLEPKSQGHHTAETAVWSAGG